MTLIIETPSNRFYRISEVDRFARPGFYDAVPVKLIDGAWIMDPPTGVNSEYVRKIGCRVVDDLCAPDHLTKERIVSECERAKIRAQEKK